MPEGDKRKHEGASPENSGDAFSGNGNSINTTGLAERRPVAVSERDAADLIQWNAYAIQARLLSEKLTVASEADAVKAIDSLKTIKEFAVGVEEARKKNLEPFNDMVSRINDSFRPIRTALEDAQSTLKLKLLEWQTGLEEKRQTFQQEQIEAYERQLEEAKGEQVPIPPITLPRENTTQGNIGAVTQRTCWKWEVEDINKVPKEYFVLNDKAINEKIREGARNIPGIRVYPEKTLSVR